MNLLHIAFANPDNVLTLSRHLADKMELTLLFVVNGKRFQQGIMNMDISSLPYGLTREAKTINAILPKEIGQFIDNKFRLWILRMPNNRFFNDFTLSNYRLCRKAIKQLKTEAFDVVHLNGTGGFLFYFLNGFRKCPKVWTLHDYIRHTGEESYKIQWLNRLYSRYTMYFVQHYQYLKQKFTEYYRVNPERVYALYSGPFTIYKSFAEQQVDVGKSNFILFFGRISKYKGLPTLIRAWQQVQAKNTDVKLVLAGKGSDPEMQELIQNTPHIITLNRYIKNEELIYLIRNCQFIVAPYTDATHSAIIATAYTFHKPVVSTKVGGIPEVILHNETGVLVETQNELELADALDSLLRNPEQIKKMETQIKKFVSTGKLSWNSISQQYLHLYKTVLANSH